MRTPSHRLTQWVHQPTKEIRAIELYDYRKDAIEKTNIAPQNPALVAKLTEQLQSEVAESPWKNEETDPRIETDPTLLSFENSRTGAFKQLESNLGTWILEAGQAQVDTQHAKTGSRCLQLKGRNRDPRHS